ncbi:hypothetical protein ACWEIJ_10265 [Lentzea sp. NPDC004789]
MINLDDVNTVAGFLITWIIRDSERSRNQEIDRRLEELARAVTEKLDDSLISRVRAEVSQTTELRPRTRKKLVSALTTATEVDREWAELLHDLVATLQTITDEAAAPPDSTPPALYITNVVTGPVNGTLIQIGNAPGDTC